MARRILILSFALLVVVLVAGALYLVRSMDAMVARAIEREGTRIAGTPVSVGSVDIDLREGVGTIRDLRVANPEGFGGGEVLELEEIELALDTGSLREPPLRLADVRIEQSTVHLEVDERGRSNLDQIVANTRSGPDEAEPGEPTRIAIDRLRFAGGTVLFDRPGADETQRLELDGFERSGIGGASGATGGEIARTFAQALARQVAASAAGDQVQRAIEEELGGRAGEAAGSLVKELLGD